MLMEACPRYNQLKSSMYRWKGEGGREDNLLVGTTCVQTAEEQNQCFDHQENEQNYKAGNTNFVRTAYIFGQPNK